MLYIRVGMNDTIVTGYIMCYLDIAVTAVVLAASGVEKHFLRG